MIVFAELRYFGISWPFDKEYALNPGYNTFLTVEQTMADYMLLIRHLKTKYDAESRAVLGFGSSYGGILATWIRMKHPPMYFKVFSYHRHSFFLSLTNSTKAFEWSLAEKASSKIWFFIYAENGRPANPVNVSCGVFTGWKRGETNTESLSRMKRQ